MTDPFDRSLEKYAEVIVKVGVNLQPGQRLMIGAPFFGIDGTQLEAVQLVRHITRTAYQAGARYVAVNWDDEALQRIRVQHGAADSMRESAAWKNDAAIAYIDNGDAVMFIMGHNPDLMGGLDPQKVQAKQQTDAQLLHGLFSKMAAGETNWLAACAPTASWAMKVFPDLAQDEAVSRLWQTIFAASRLNQDDPVSGWERHLANLGERSAYLNGKQYTALKYTAPGTDLTVGLPAGHIWHSGGLTSQSGINFVANIPTEEVFTMAHSRRVDGVVTASMPLSYGGSFIDHFTLTFSEGRVVHATAETGQAALDKLLDSDETSRSLGEAALVPHSSPISQTNLLFYQVLFDENAANHLALGNAYRFNMKGGEEMTAEEFAAAGGNESMTHADFMIGSDQMNVDGIDGQGAAEPVMRDGEWAFEV
jgi:aminopeptidase